MTADSDVQLVKISDLARMSGVPTPTIKHYLREGLLPGPARRTSRNMAYYDARLARRVRAIKDLQQTRFLPLRVIAEVLEPAPSSSVRADLDELQRQQLGLVEPAGRTGLRTTRQRRPASTRGHATASRTRADILTSMNMDAAELGLLAELGLARPDPAAGEEVYSGSDLDIIEVIHEARDQGMGDVFVDVLPPYIEAVKKLVHMELDMFRRCVLAGARLPSRSPSEITRVATQLSERLVVAMRDKIVMRELGTLSGDS